MNRWCDAERQFYPNTFNATSGRDGADFYDGAAERHVVGMIINNTGNHLVDCRGLKIVPPSLWKRAVNACADFVGWMESRLRLPGILIAAFLLLVVLALGTALFTGAVGLLTALSA